MAGFTDLQFNAGLCPQPEDFLPRNTQNTRKFSKIILQILFSYIEKQNLIFIHFVCSVCFVVILFFIAVSNV